MTQAVGFVTTLRSRPANISLCPWANPDVECPSSMGKREVPREAQTYEIPTH